MVPKDIRDRVAKDFDDEDEQELALMVVEELSEKFERQVVRCAVYMADGDLDKLAEAESLAQSDHKDLVMLAECDPLTGKRLRNLAKSFSDDSPEAKERALYRDAMRAFRKRLRLYRLDDESRLGGAALTEGKSSSITAIMPPDSYPQEVWDKLVEQEKLVINEEGSYELVEDGK